MKFKHTLINALLVPLVAFGFDPADKQINSIIGQELKYNLEQKHFRLMKVDDDLSKKAFNQYIEKLDYGKQFLIKSDIEKLRQYELEMDDMLKSGDLKIVKKSIDILANRVAEVRKYEIELFKNQKFDFKKDETLEHDPDKRKYFDNSKELKEYWRKALKQATLNRYITLLEDQKEEVDQSKENKTTKKDKKNETLKQKNISVDKGKVTTIPKQKEEEKPGPDLKNKENGSLIGLSENDLLTKARESVRKKYKRFFDRMLKDRFEDHAEKFYNAITEIYDPHTNYMPPKKKEDFNIEITGSLEGIGAVLSEDGSYIKVVQIVPGGAAWKQKELEVDDIILRVGQGEKGGEDVDLEDMRVDDAVRYIRGKKGTIVRLTVKKADGTRKIIRILRDRVQIGESFAKSSIITHSKTGDKIGYIYLPKFYRNFRNPYDPNATEDVRKELRTLKSKKVKGIILDLRNNGGGSLPDAQMITGLFIKEGPVVQVKNFNGYMQVLKDSDPGIEYEGPLVVLVNRFSASASEILAGALQDYKRAIIVGGEFTHGKGTVQGIYEVGTNPFMNMSVDNLGSLKITVQKYYRITGASTQFKGVTPDVILPDSYGYTESREQDLDNALPWDEVPGQTFEIWKNQKYNIDDLRKKSEVRTKDNKKLQKIAESVTYLKKKRDETVSTLNIDKLKKEIEENKKINETFKKTDPSEDITVSDYEDSLMRNNPTPKKVDKKAWKEEFDQRRKEWVEGLQKDAILEEALFIIHDMLS